MQTATSILSGTFQAVVPEIVRKKLCLDAGDLIAFEIENDNIKIRKATPLHAEFHEALPPTLSEWDSANDEEAYRDL